MHTKTVLRGGALALLASLTALALPTTPAGAVSNLKPVNALVSVAPSGKTGNGQSMVSSLSNGGRYVAFASVASDLVPGDTNGKSDVFVRDVLTATTIRVSVAPDGSQGNGTSDQPSISRDGRYVAFRSDATNLVAGDTNGVSDVFARDLRNKISTRASVTPSGWEATGGGSSHPVFAGFGYQVAFDSDATNLAPGDANGATDVFVRDFDTSTTDRITVTSAEAALTLGGRRPSVSGNGRYVTFTSMTNQVGAFTDSNDDVFIRDRVAGTTDRVSLANEPGTHPNNSSSDGAVSDDGRYVAFTSIAGNISPSTDSNGAGGVYLRDRQLNSTTLVSVSTTGGTTPLGTVGAPSITADGQSVAFAGLGTGFLTGDSNNSTDVFVRTIGGTTTTRLSTTTGGNQLDNSSQYPLISADGTAITYSTLSKAGYPLDTNSGHDVYVRAVNQLGPFSTTTSLLQRNAKDFTGSTLSAAALKAADDKIQFGTASTGSTINAWAHGTFDDHRGPILRLYWAFFKRSPDTGGLNYWAGKHAGGMKIAQIANGFAKSHEFQTNFGGGNDTQFITLVYTNVLERQPDPAGLAHWVAKMKTGTTRGEMLINFSESAEGKRKMRGEVDTELVFLGMLHRAPSTGEVISYANALELQGGQATEVLILAVLTWDEYHSLVH